MTRTYIHVIASSMIIATTLVAAEPNGEQIYKARCANCHGASGEGSPKFKRRLEGDRSIAQLAKLIHDTMPENNPGALSEKESAAVAAYVHDAFYSIIARERNRPARVEMSRLTVKQYRQAVADVVGSFRRPMTWNDQRGLKGDYFAGRRLGGRGVMERTDPQVDFNFGIETPAPGKIEPHEFSIRWTGSVLAPETGEYEFVLRTDHATRLWINDQNRPLIDAWVKSGKDLEYRGAIFLVAGRAYPLKLEFTKAKQGVDDSNKQKTKPPPAKAQMALLWKRPHGIAETVPSRQLSPIQNPPSFVCSTPFPPDDRSYGWERGTTISKEWDAAATDAALETAAYVAERLPELAGVRDDAKDRDVKLKAFGRTFAERAFRRPLTAEQLAFVDRQFSATKDLDLAVKRVVLLVLKSPRFLYREPGGADGYDVASRLSFALWDSIPDAELLSAAAGGKLATREQMTKQAERMLADPRAKAKLRDFLMTWAKADHVPDLMKDPKKFPGFDSVVIADLRTSLVLFLDEILWSEASDFRKLLLAEDLPLNGRLNAFYGLERPLNTDFAPARLDSGKRAGVLTHPYLLAAFAHSGESSPIHRGVFLARGVLGIALRPPPEAVTPLAPELHPSLTTRERVILQTKANTCMSCHGIINPLGFTLEQFDAVGRFRDNDRGKLIDATGSYRTRAGNNVEFKTVRELATFLANSEEVHLAFVEQMFHHLVQQPLRAYGPTTGEDLRKAFAANGFNMRKLAVQIVATAALQKRN